jgi:hypothetical protein
VLDNQAKPKEDFKKPFLRARRTLRHLWHINRGDTAYNPDSCDGCKEIHRFLTDPDYRGDEHYPVGVDENPLGPEQDPEAALGPNWKLGPGEIEGPVEPIPAAPALRLVPPPIKRSHGTR